MKKQEVTFTIWDGGGSFTIDFTKPYYQYIRLFSVSSFKKLTDTQAITLLKTIIKDFRAGKLNPDVLCGLCYEMFFACDIFHQDKKLNDLMLSLTELSFDLRNSPVCATESLDNAFTFARSSQSETKIK
jgi:hypothetical protein